MKKPQFEFKKYSIDEAYEFVDIYKEAAKSFSSDSGMDVSSFLNLLDEIKRSFVDGKKFKSFPRKQDKALDYLIDLRIFLEKEREALASRFSKAKAKIGTKLAQERQEINNLINHERDLVRVKSLISHFEDAHVYPNINLVNDLKKHNLENTYDRNYFYKSYRNIISERIARLEGNQPIIFPDIAQLFTIIETDKILIENGLLDYGIYEVTRSNHRNIRNGTYFYSFDKQDNLLVMAPPFKFLNFDGSKYIVFDAKLYKSNKVISIPKTDILSFKLYGTELMQSSVSTNRRPNEVEVLSPTTNMPYQRPSISGTFFSSLLFGSAFTILNGVGKQMHQQTNVLGNKLDGLRNKMDEVVSAINNISITTDHKIIDTSRVQIVLTDRRDLEIDGIHIFYDLNRMYPNLDKASESSTKQIEQPKGSSPSLAKEILELKQLLDQGIIDEEEFKSLKKKLIN